MDPAARYGFASASSDRVRPLQSRQRHLELSEAAVACLHLRVRGLPLRGHDLPAYSELAAAGIVEPSEGPGFRFTPRGLEHREAILERESERIERGRRVPPDRDLPDAARDLLRRIAAGRVEVGDADRPAFRELAAARILSRGSSFAGGPGSAYRLTYWSAKMQDELLTCENKYI